MSIREKLRRGVATRQPTVLVCLFGRAMGSRPQVSRAQAHVPRVRAGRRQRGGREVRAVAPNHQRFYAGIAANRPRANALVAHHAGP